MNSAEWFILGVLAFAVVRARAAERTRRAQWEEDLPVNGTDWCGDMWERLGALDLRAPLAKDRNLANGTIADPGRIGQADIGLMPGWNGNL